MKNLKKIIVTILTTLFISSFFLVGNVSAIECPGLSSCGNQNSQGEQTKSGGGKNKGCTGTDSLCSPDFEIKTSNIFPGRVQQTGTSSDNVNDALGKIIRFIMIPFGVLTVFFLVIGAGFLIFGGANDSLLTKGKTIIKIALFALVIALSSYIVMSIVARLIYA